LKAAIVGLGLFVVCCGSALAQDRPTVKDCAGVYGALAQEQGAFGSTDSLMGERYANFAKIDFNDRLAQLARKEEMGITELQTSSETQRSADYMKLVDAETEGTMDSPEVLGLTRLSDTCDAEYGFNPSLGG
jgi:hypothetical protein